MPSMTLNDPRLPQTYSAARAFLGDRYSRNAGNNTEVVERGEDIAVRLHSTDVLTFHPDGSVTLNTGGYYTVTTKDRINRFSPWWLTSVYQRDHEWYVVINRKWDAPLDFVDGMTVDPDGLVH